MNQVRTYPERAQMSTKKRSPEKDADGMSVPLLDAE